MVATRPALACLLLLVAACSTQAALDNVITQWQVLVQDTVRAYTINNQIAALYHGLVGVAQYEAVTVALADGADEVAAAAFAGHAILSGVFPWRQVTIYDSALKKQVANLTTAQLDAAEAAGVGAARPILQARVGNQATRWARFEPAPPNGPPYQYQYSFNNVAKTILYPQLADTEPLAYPSVALRNLTTNKDAAKGPVFQPPKNDYNATFGIGNKANTARTPLETETAYYWADGANTSAVVGHVVSVAHLVLPSNLSTYDAALLYARLGAALYDANIAAWQVKYRTLHWRPSTAFRQGYPGGPAAVPDWTPTLGADPAHPEYPSGHAITVGAAFEVLRRFLGTDNVTFTLGTEGAGPNGTVLPARTYTSFTQAALDAGDSRVWGGVHFPSANTDGRLLAELVAGYVYENYGAGSDASGGVDDVLASAGP